MVTSILLDLVMQHAAPLLTQRAKMAVALNDMTSQESFASGVIAEEHIGVLDPVYEVLRYTKDNWQKGLKTVYEKTGLAGVVALLGTAMVGRHMSKETWSEMAQSKGKIYDALSGFIGTIATKSASAFDSVKELVMGSSKLKEKVLDATLSNQAGSVHTNEQDAVVNLSTTTNNTILASDIQVDGSVVPCDEGNTVVFTIIYHGRCTYHRIQRQHKCHVEYVRRQIRTPRCSRRTVPQRVEPGYLGRNNSSPLATSYFVRTP
jgi:hypothetical protein